MGNIAIERNMAYPTKNPKKKAMTPFNRLKRRIYREFKKKKLVGDIAIKENEYELLLKYFKNKSKRLFDSSTGKIEDPVFATAIVQIGIRHYDGKLWPHIADILGIRKLKQRHRDVIGTSFISTLLFYNKILINKNEYVKNILMHGFVSDHYADEMFEFLFKYYNLDLERDLQRNDKEMMDGLIETIQKSDSTGRTYLLVKQTADAISANIRGGKIRIRWLLRLIDKCFWEQITPFNPVSRISKLFNKWQRTSEEFKIQYNKYRSGKSKTGYKSFISPYLKCNYYTAKFDLILPAQLIRFEHDNDIKWIITNGENENVIEATLYQVVTGYKTETIKINIEPSELFNKMELGLYCGDKRIRLFKIRNDCIRFFDKDGDYLNPDIGLSRGEAFAFTRCGETPESEALLEAEPVGNLLRTCFEFEHGDIVKLPDGKAISIGKKIEEGLLYRKSVPGCYALKDNMQIPVYSSPPSIMLKIQTKKLTGTLIDINGIRYRLTDNKITEVSLKDRSDETGYLINLNNLGCTMDGIYKVYIDVPNDRTNRKWSFALIKGIGYEFEDAPYIFKLRGTIKFNNDLILNTEDEYIERNSDDNSYNFKILSEIDDLHFICKTINENIDLFFEIPVFKWGFKASNWNIEKPSDIWHSNFPSKIYMKYPDDRIIISLDEMRASMGKQESSVTCIKSKSKGIFECNLMRFKSWFGRDEARKGIFIDFAKDRVEFIGVITKSTVTSQILKGDFEANLLIGEFKIVGHAKYYADIMLLDADKIIKTKVPIINGRFEFKDKLASGPYKITIFENEGDDLWFGTSNYLPIGEFMHEIINPNNLNGKNIELKYFSRNAEGAGKYFFSCRYVVCNLEIINDKNKGEYQGMLMINAINHDSPICYKVKVDFVDTGKLRHIYLTFFDGYDYLEFLYDFNKKIIAKKEENGLSWAARYRRYEPLYSEDYYYAIEFTSDVPQNYALSSGHALSEIAATKNPDKIVASKIKTYADTPLSKVGLSNLVLNCLKNSNIYTVKDVINKGANRLGYVRGLNKKMHKELIDKLYSFGFRIGGD